MKCKNVKADIKDRTAQQYNLKKNIVGDAKELDKTSGA